MSYYLFPFVSQYIELPEFIDDRVEIDYAAEKNGVRHCIKLIITNILVLGVVSYSRRKEFYAHNHTTYYTYYHMMRAIEVLVRDRYILKHNRRTGGFWSKGQYTNGISSRLQPLEKLFEDYPEKINNLTLNLDSLPILTIDKYPIYSLRDISNRDKSNRDKDKNKIRNNPDTHFSLFYPYGTIFRQCQYLNRHYFHKIKLDFSNLKLKDAHVSQVGLHRAFSKGGCGRYFQRGGYSYQSISESERLKILIDGYEVAELDYTAMHPNILYSLEGTQAPDDIYGPVIDVLKEGYVSVTKFMVKKVILTAINTKDYRGLTSSINLNKAGEMKANQHRVENGFPEKPILYDELKRCGLEPKVIVEAFKQVHPTIEKHVYGYKANKLMLYESQVMTHVLFHLMRVGIPAIPIHDSLLFPRQHWDQVKYVMEDVYQRLMKFDIQVK
ncbi:hypothetical protein ACFLU3_02000 [Chloroflexota bacterium]